MPVRLGLSAAVIQARGRFGLLRAKALRRRRVNRPYRRRLSRRLGWLLLGALMLDRYLFFRRHFVFRVGHAHQPMIEPADNILQSFHPMPRLTGARKLVRLVWKTHHDCRNFAKLERAEHLVATGAWRRSEIGLAQ